jgi:hypothetical protein
MNDTDHVVFVYQDEAGKYICHYLFGGQPVSGWMHLETIDPRTWIEVGLNEGWIRPPRLGKNKYKLK